MVCSGSADEPSLKEVRCVPRAWVVPTKVVPKKVWDDAGTGGRSGSMWVVNSLGLVHVCEGHNAPTEKFYDLYGTRFMAAENIGAMNFGNEVMKEDEDLPGEAGPGTARYSSLLHISSHIFILHTSLIFFVFLKHSYSDVATRWT